MLTFWRLITPGQRTCTVNWAVGVCVCVHMSMCECIIQKVCNRLYIMGAINGNFTWKPACFCTVIYFLYLVPPINPTPAHHNGKGSIIQVHVHADNKNALLPHRSRCGDPVWKFDIYLFHHIFRYCHCILSAVSLEVPLRVGLINVVISLHVTATCKYTQRLSPTLNRSSETPVLKAK